MFHRFLFNEPAKKLLNSLFSEGRYPHALLLEGPSGCGKTVCAIEVAARILCRQPDPACGRCLSCRKAFGGNHPDIILAEKEAGKQQLGVDIVRSIRNSAYILPNESPYKVIIIKNAHDMNSNAQNALLKILEEPPAHCIFILTAVSRTRLLPTILSRVTPVLLHVPTPQQCLQVLPQLVPGQEEGDYFQAAFVSGGNIGTAVRLLSQKGGMEIYQKALLLTQALFLSSEYELLQFLFTLEKDKTRLLEILQKSKEQLVSLLLHKKGCPLMDPSLESIAPKITPLQALSFIDIIEDTLNLARQNVSETILLSSMCARIKKENPAG